MGNCDIQNSLCDHIPMIEVIENYLGCYGEDEGTCYGFSLYISISLSRSFQDISNSLDQLN